MSLLQIIGNLNSKYIISKGVCIGDSTVASTNGQTAINVLMFTAGEIALGYECQSIAVPGHTINQQLALWNSYANKATVDWIIVEIGLNDTRYDEAAQVAMARYQNLINTINTDKKTNAKILVATMTPCRGALILVQGATNGEIAYQKWLLMNESIMGGGSFPITGVHYRMNRHTALLNDGNGYLLDVYDSYVKDHVHETTEARAIIAGVWRDGLKALKLYR